LRKMTSLRISLVMVEHAMASDSNPCTSSVWTSLALAEAPSNGETRQLTFDPYSQHTGLTNGAVKEPRNGFFLHDWVSDPKVVILHNHHKASFFCPSGIF
jgi:hypothetical protein